MCQTQVLTHLGLMLNALTGKVAAIHIIVFWSDRISLEIMISLDDFYSQRSRLLLRMLDFNLKGKVFITAKTALLLPGKRSS
jgi:hypothetical protein